MYVLALKRCVLFDDYSSFVIDIGKVWKNKLNLILFYFINFDFIFLYVRIEKLVEMVLRSRFYLKFKTSGD
jgi:hypothetical protein